MEDILIQNALIADGSGAPLFEGSITVRDGRITGVYHIPHYAAEARRTIDAGRLVASPGFVDTHTHSDMLLLHDGRQPSSITQGVTTEIIGQDGLSYAPLSTSNLQSYAPYLKGLNGQYDDVSLDFESVDQYLSRFTGHIAVNAAWLVPHCALRLETAGFENRLMTAEEMACAREILRCALQQGGKGLSTGLSYFPGAFSDTQELIALCGTVQEQNAVYVTHLRTVFHAKPFDGVDEALEIARKTGVKLHFSHYRTGVGTLGKSAGIMHKIDRAMAEGLDITLELYPYPYGASYAPMFLPMWASEGGFDAIMERLSDIADRTAIAAYINREFPGFDAMIAYAGVHPEYMGKTFSKLAKAENISTGELITRLLASEELALGFHDIEPALVDAERELFKNDIFALLSRPGYMVGSDAIHLGEYPHPRGWGTFPRLLRMARESGFGLGTLIERMTHLPCRRFGLRHRGLLKEGNWADIAIFDADTITDRATVSEPRLPAEGMHYVFVNGVLAMDNGRLTDALAGQVLS